jgi:hypothetical protein
MRNQQLQETVTIMAAVLEKSAKVGNNKWHCIT